MTIKTTRPHNHEVAKEILHKEQVKEELNQINFDDEKTERNIEDKEWVGNEEKVDVMKEAKEKGSNAGEGRIMEKGLTDKKAGDSNTKVIGPTEVGDNGSVKYVTVERSDMQRRGEDSTKKKNITKQLDLAEEMTSEGMERTSVKSDVEGGEGVVILNSNIN